MDDQRPYDNDPSVMYFDSEPMSEKKTLVGMARVSLRVSASAPIANWVVRLEDVAPSGAVFHLTGAIFSGVQRQSRVR